MYSIPKYLNENKKFKLSEYLFSTLSDITLVLENHLFEFLIFIYMFLLEIHPQRAEDDNSYHSLDIAPRCFKYIISKL